MDEAYRDELRRKVAMMPRKELGRQKRSGCGGAFAFAIISSLVLGSLFAFATKRIKAQVDTQQLESAQSMQYVVTAVPSPTITLVPTETPNYYLATESSARAEAAILNAQAAGLQLTNIAAEATEAAYRRADQYNRDCQATEAVFAATMEAARTLSVYEAQAQAQQNADSAELARVDRNIYAGRRVLFEIVVPIVAGGLALVLLFVGVVRGAQFVGRVAREDIEDDEQEDVDDNVPTKPVIEIVSPNHRNIIRSHVSSTVLRILPLFADYALDVGVDDNANPLTDTVWAGEQKRGVTKGDWYTFRSWLIDNRFAQWKNEQAHAQGAELTDSGWLLMKGVVENGVPSPTELGLTKT